MELIYIVQAFHSALLENNLCIIMFVLYTVIISLSGTAINYLSAILPIPDFFLQTFKFGKMFHKGKRYKIIAKIEIPKKYFFHFYITASLIVTVALYEAWCMYVKGSALSAWMQVVLDYLTIPQRKASVDATTAALSLTLLALQIYRRLYENLCVSVFSSGSINILHYIVGHTHYIGAVALLLSETPGFDGRKAHISPNLSVAHLIGTAVSFYGFYVQNQSLRILAGLRKLKGKTLVEKHIMPVGGMFEVVSCPHMMAEVLVYIGIMITLRFHTGWLFVLLWVISNQIQVAVMNHKWYQTTFKDYPKNRRAIFPFLL